MEETPDFLEDQGSLQEDLLHRFIGDQVEVALTVPGFGVFESVPLAGRRTQGLPERGEGLNLHAGLAHAGDEKGAFNADEISQIQELEDFGRIVTEHLGLNPKLDPAADIAQVKELTLTHVTVGRDAARQTNTGALGQAHGITLGLGRFVPFRPTGQLGSNGTALGIGSKRVHERVDAPCIESGQILAALFDQGIGVLHGEQKSGMACFPRHSAEGPFNPMDRQVEKSEDGVPLGRKKRETETSATEQHCESASSRAIRTLFPPASRKMKQAMCGDFGGF